MKFRYLSFILESYSTVTKFSRVLYIYLSDLIHKIKMVGKQTFDVDPSDLLRKVRKPMVEKRRRDRMNVGIEQLRTLLAESHTGMSMVKMDKAEVLEHAVRHLTMLTQRQQTTCSATKSTTVAYTAGFQDCSRETVRYLEKTGTVPQYCVRQLDSHLRHTCTHKSGPTATFLRDQTGSDSSRQHHFTSTPVSTAGYHRDSVSPVFHQSFSFPQLSPLDMRRQFNISPSTSFDSRSQSPADSGISSSASVSSLASSGEDNDHMDIQDTGSDIIKEGEPWRPW